MIDIQITEISQLVFLFFFFMCVLWVVYSLIAFIADLNKLRLRLTDLDIELDSERLDLPLRKGRVSTLKRKVPASKRTHRSLDEYFVELRNIEREIEEQERLREEADKKKREEEEAKGRIKLREWDF